MSWVGLGLLVIGAYLAYKLVGALLKVAMCVLALVGAYWLAAPHMGWPTVSELVYVLGPDFGGQRIEQVVRPSAIAGEVADRVVDGVVERIVAPSPGTPVAEAPATGPTGPDVPPERPQPVDDPAAGTAADGGPDQPIR